MSEPTDPTISASLERVLHHEAGHAIMALVLGDRVERISTIRDRETAGRTLITPDSRFTEVMIALAGEVAAEMAIGPAGLGGSASDTARADAADGGVPLDQYREHARFILRIHWHLVERLVAVLRVRRVLAAEELREAVGTVAPRMPTPVPPAAVPVATLASVVQHGYEGTGIDVAATLIAELSQRSAKHPEPDAVWSTRLALVADLRERARFGQAKYGRPLRPHDGRDTLVDMYQEALDGCVYARKGVEEGRAVEGIFRAWLDLALAIRGQIEADARQGIGAVSDEAFARPQLHHKV